MKIRKGNMWDEFDNSDYFIITTNSFIKQDGCLVMGRGIAKEALNKFSNIAAHTHDMQHLGVYGYTLACTYNTTAIGFFQVKTHFKDKAELDIIKISATALKRSSLAQPNKTFNMNFPGIGWGHLTMEAVLPIIADLPDNVNIWIL